MKTSEIRNYMKAFCEVLNRANKRLNFKFEEDQSNMKIVKHIGKFRGDVCSVLKDTQDIYAVNVSGDIKCINARLFNFIEKVQRYASTPLNEREDEKRWYIRLSEESNAYLNLRKDNEFYFIGNKHNLSESQTEYTRSEIEDWAETINDDVIDWIIGKFGEEV